MLKDLPILLLLLISISFLLLCCLYLDKCLCGLKSIACMIFVFSDLLRYVLYLRMYSVLVNVPCKLKNVYSSLVA